MEVRARYKQTEVGVMPVEWGTVRLADVSALITKGSTPTTYGFGWQSSGILFLRSECVSPEGLDLAQSMFISAEAHRTLRRSAIQSNDLLITITGNVGRVVAVPAVFGEANINQHIARIRIVDEATHPGWVYHFLSQPGVRRHFEKITTGQAYPQISLVQVRDAFIPRPAITEQRAIAAALSDVDALLGGLERLIAKKRNLKQAAMQQLLTGQTRLPVFRGAWEVKRLGDVCRITTGKKDVNEGNPNGQFPFFTCSRSCTFSDSYSFDTEAILIAGNGEVGNLHYFNGKFEAYQRTYVLSEFSAHVQYLWQQLSAYLADSLGLGKIGSSIPYIKKGNLVGFEFKSSRDPAEQTAIAAVLSDMDAELAALEARRDKTRDLKQAMMQELLTGRTRLI